MLRTCGAFTPQGAFLELAELDLDWSGCRRPGRKACSPRPGVPGASLAEDKIEPEVVENMRTWPHSGFSVDQSVYLPAGDRAEVLQPTSALVWGPD